MYLCFVLLFVQAVYANEFSVRGGYISPLKQLPQFDWITVRQAKTCIATIQAAINDYGFAKYEEPIDHPACFEDKDYDIQGYIDMLTPDTIWELKCVQELTDEHILQLAVYGWIWKESYVLYLNYISITS